MNAMEMGWNEKHGTAIEKDAAVEKLNNLRTSGDLSLALFTLSFSR